MNIHNLIRTVRRQLNGRDGSMAGRAQWQGGLNGREGSMAGGLNGKEGSMARRAQWQGGLNGKKAQWQEGLAQDRRILGSGPSHDKLPL